MKYEVLFVCSANVGRSQMAEALYNYYGCKGKSISAAGIEDVRAKYNFQPHRAAVKVMLERGIDISKNTVKFVTPKLVADSKRIILFCDPKKCPDFLAKCPKVEFVPIEDPYVPNIGAEEELARFRLARDRAEKFVQNLINS